MLDYLNLAQNLSKVFCLSNNLSKNHLYPIFASLIKKNKIRYVQKLGNDRRLTFTEGHFTVFNNILGGQVH